MPCDKACIPALMKRLRTLPFYGEASDFTDLRDEVGRALLGVAQDNSHAETIVGGLIRRLHKFPVPADVYEEAEGTRSPPSTVTGYVPPPPPDCAKCNDLGWYAVPGEKGRGGCFQACECAVGRDSLELVTKMNQRFTPGGKPQQEKRAMSGEEFARRVGL